MTEGDFEGRWQRDVAAHYGWLGWAEAAGAFWAGGGTALAWLVWRGGGGDRGGKGLLEEGGTGPAPGGPNALRPWECRGNPCPGVRPALLALSPPLSTA